MPRDWATPSLVAPRWSEPEDFDEASNVAGLIAAARERERERETSSGLRMLAVFGAFVLVMGSLLVSATIIGVGVGYTLTLGRTFEAIGPGPMSPADASAGGASNPLGVPLGVELGDGAPDPATLAHLLAALDGCTGRITITDPGGDADVEAISARIAAAGIPADRIDIELGRQDGRITVACRQ
jgi:hypothetical protein